MRGASHPFDLEAYLRRRADAGVLRLGHQQLRRRGAAGRLRRVRTGPAARDALQRQVAPAEQKFTGFVFKIQANMDPAHRDRIAFLRVCSGRYRKGMKMRHVRIGKTVQIANAITFLADERRHVEEAWPGDIIGLHNHGTIQIGDTFTEGEALKYGGIPIFAPELFRRVVLKDPLRMKALQKGVIQLSEEGATQVFRPLQEQRPDPGRRRRAAVRRGRLPAEGRVRGGARWSSR